MCLCECPTVTMDQGDGIGASWLAGLPLSVSTVRGLALGLDQALCFDPVVSKQTQTCCALAASSSGPASPADPGGGGGGCRLVLKWV